jgi:hypothetical protein
MSIKVYWSCLEDEWLRASGPENVYSNFLKNNQFETTGVHRCPAFVNSLKNTYALRSLYNYDFKISENSVGSTYYDQDFFNEHVNVRSLQERTFSFNQYYTFFTEEDSLTMTGNLQPYLENNNITDRCTVFPGAYDIGKWFRNIEFSFYLKPQYDTFVINEGEIYTYLKFHTEEKIEFIQYRHSTALVSHLREIMASRNHTAKSRNLFSYYNMFKTKKMILKEIKKNIL